MRFIIYFLIIVSPIHNIQSSHIANGQWLLATELDGAGRGLISLLCEHQAPLEFYGLEFSRNAASVQREDGGLTVLCFFQVHALVRESNLQSFSTEPSQPVPNLYFIITSSFFSSNGPTPLPSGNHQLDTRFINSLIART